MRDFERDVFLASKEIAELPAGEFSWTPSRRSLFMRCRRAYYLNYFAAQGGWNLHAGAISKSAYFEKHLKSLDMWMTTMFEEAFVSSILKSSRHEFASSFGFELGMRIAAMRKALEDETYLNDPKVHGILEFHQRRKDYDTPSAIAERAGAIFKNAFSCFVESAFLGNLLLLNAVNFKNLRDKFLYFRVNGINLCFRHGVIYTERGIPSLLRFDLGESRADLDEKIALNGYDCSMFQKYLASRGYNKNFQYNCFSASAECVSLTCAPSEEVDFEDTLYVDSTAMLKNITLDGTVKAEDFPPCDDKNQCIKCRFCASCVL